ncbi:MAG: hypothetical protein KAT34_02065 [Candidatus Aminicenantes bacterium]|nr:hypothetical protein [Candidatus Aminicenantes bacterium]
MTLSLTNKRSRLTKTKLYKSFKLDKNFLYVILIDLAYYAIFFGSIAIFLRNAIPEITVTQLAKDLVGLLSKETMALYQNDLSIIQAARNNLTWYSIILTLVLFLNFSCLKLWIWHLVAKKKYGIFLLVRGIIVNFVFFIVIFSSGLAGFYILNMEMFYIWLLLLIPISIYFLNWVHLSFTQKGGISAICQGISLGIKGFFQVLFPNSLLIILFFLLIFIFKMLDAINPKIYWPLVLISITIFLNWAKRLLYLFKKPFFPNR